MKVMDFVTWSVSFYMYINYVFFCSVLLYAGITEFLLHCRQRVNSIFMTSAIICSNVGNCCCLLIGVKRN